MLASYHGHPALVELLLAHGANPNTLNDRNQSPLAGAVFKNESAVIKALLGGGADPDLGTPSAAEALMLFKLSHVWGKAFDEARRNLHVKSGIDKGAVPEGNGEYDVRKD